MRELREIRLLFFAPKVPAEKMAGKIGGEREADQRAAWGMSRMSILFLHVQNLSMNYPLLKLLQYNNTICQPWKLEVVASFLV